MSTWKDTGALTTKSGGTGFITHPAGCLLTGTGGAGPDGLAQTLIGAAGRILQSDGSAPQWVTGDYIDVAFSAGNFTADTGTFVVAAGDQTTYAYQRGFLGELKLQWSIVTATITGAPSYLKIALPLGLTIQRSTEMKLRVFNGGAWNEGICIALSGETFIRIYKTTAGAAYTNETDLTSTGGQITLSV